MSDIVRIDFDQAFEAKSGNRYRNLQLLGTGRNASTFLVLATSGTFRGTPFALKLFRRLSKPERRDDFLGEVEFLHSCQHPSIMRIFDEGIYRHEHPFVVAEYLPQTLRNIMGAVTTNVEKICYSLQLLSALAYLDEREPQVVHRDIKPENIFVKGRSCVLGDFGLMKRLPADAAEDRERLKESLGPGMPRRYRTPDLVSYARGKSTITTKSDVFQLGLVLAELFTGSNPLRAARAIRDPVKMNPLGKIPGELGGKIASLIEDMLEYDPARRRPASSFFSSWEGVFLDAARRAHALDGRVF